jgi:hypothetical protein
MTYQKKLLTTVEFYAIIMLSLMVKDTKHTFIVSGAARGRESLPACGRSNVW